MVTISPRRQTNKPVEVNLDKMVIVRKAEQKDCQAVADLIKELAIFEKMPDEALLTSADLERDGFALNPPLFRIFIAEEEHDGGIIGFALFYYMYSTWKGKCMVLEDLYVKPEHRNKQVGSKLFDAVVKIALDEDCRRMDFEVLDWNPARRFYHRKGAVDVSEAEGWHMYRVTQQRMREIVGDI